MQFKIRDGGYVDYVFDDFPNDTHTILAEWVVATAEQVVDAHELEMVYGNEYSLTCAFKAELRSALIGLLSFGDAERCDMTEEEAVLLWRTSREAMRKKRLLGT
jgi:hypothetical protein